MEYWFVIELNKKEVIFMEEKNYIPPRAKMKGDTKSLVVAAVHKGCSSSSARTKKG